MHNTTSMLVELGAIILALGLLGRFAGRVGFSPIPLYLLAGLSCWTFFSVSLQASARSMIDSGELIKKVRFPRQLVALSTVATQAVTFAIMVGILLVLSLIFVPAGRATVWLAIPLAVVSPRDGNLPRPSRPLHVRSATYATYRFATTEPCPTSCTPISA